jgi:ABC-type tungstate transport system permease subunit
MLKIYWKVKTIEMKLVLVHAQRQEKEFSKKGRNIFNKKGEIYKKGEL